MSLLEDQARLRPFLLPGERVLWTGRPRRGFVRRDFDIPGAVGAAAFALFGVYLYLDEGGFERMEPIHGFNILLPLALLALAALLFLFRPLRLRRVVYAVTNQRALILGRKRRNRLESQDLGWLPTLSLEQVEARGTIFMSEPPEPTSLGQAFSSRAPDPESGFAFVGIERPQQVYDIIARESRNRRADLNRDLPVGMLA